VGLVFDFGGGTLDLTVAELGGAQPPRVIANHGVLVGGDDLDRRLMRHLMRHFGTEAYMRSGETFPIEVVNLLRDWQTMPELSRPEYRDMMDYLVENSTAPDSVKALDTLVSQNLGFSLFQEIERAKKRLSRSSRTFINFCHQDVRVREIIPRREFERLIAEDVARVDHGIRQVVAAAGLRPADIDIVLRTGGSSLVPAFIRLLAHLFGEEKLREMDPLTSVVGGLAVAASAQSIQRPAYAERYMRPDNRVIEGLAVRGSRPCQRYEIRVGEQCYADNPAYTITRLPVDLVGLPAVRTVNLDRCEERERFLRFHLNRPARVFVAYKAGTTELPKWLRSFKPTGFDIEVTQYQSHVPFTVFGKDFPAGTVVLGANQAPGFRGEASLHYLVVVQSHAAGCGSSSSV
jgi:hypothetical protein